MLNVTRRDVADAAIIAQILGEYHAAFPCSDEDVDLCCKDGSTFMHIPEGHCESCTCVRYDYGDCGHREGVWQCIATAIGASSAAVALWMRLSNIISDLDPGAREINKNKDPDVVRWLAEQAGDARGRKRICEDLETAALLREGTLPPGVEVVSAAEKQRAKKEREA